MRTVPIDRPPPVVRILVPTFVDRGMSSGQRGGIPTSFNLNFLDHQSLLLLLLLVVVVLRNTMAERPKHME
jgi:hypothetical protein